LARSNVESARSCYSKNAPIRPLFDRAMIQAHSQSLRGTEEPSEFVLPGVISIPGLDKFNFAIVNTFGDYREFRVGNLKAERLNSFASRRDIDRVKLPQISYKNLFSF
jgi:hypothetical protein